MDKQHKIILGNRPKFGQFFGRFKNESNKFIIESVVRSYSSSTDEDDHETMMDKIYKYTYIDFEEYDTDSLFYFIIS